MKILHPASGSALPISHPVRFDGTAADGITTVTFFANGTGGDIPLGRVSVADTRWTFVRNFSQKGIRTITAVGLNDNDVEVDRAVVSIELRLSHEFGYTPPELTLHHLGDIAGLLEIATPINATFSPKDNVKGLFRLPGNQFYFDSNLDLDTDGKESPGIIFEPTHKKETSLRFPGGDSLDPNKVPFIVLPGLHHGLGPKKMTIGGMTFALGDIAAVLFGNKIEFCVCGDFGKAVKIGEGSIALHRSLGHETVLPSGHIHDVDIEQRVITIIFPGSGDGLPHTPDVIREKGKALFTALGGVLS